MSTSSNDKLIDLNWILYSSGQKSTPTDICQRKFIERNKQNNKQIIYNKRKGLINKGELKQFTTDCWARDLNSLLSKCKLKSLPHNHSFDKQKEPNLIQYFKL